MQTNTAQGAFTLITYAIGHNQMTAPGGAEFTTMGRTGHTPLNVARRLVLAKGGAEPVTVRHYLPHMDPEADATLIRTLPDDQPHSSPDLTLLALKALLPLAEARVILTHRRDPWARKAEAAIAFAHAIQSGASIEEAVPLLLAYQAACYTATEQLHAAGVGWATDRLAEGAALFGGRP
jgi:hypothetical protein